MTASRLSRIAISGGVAALLAASLVPLGALAAHAAGPDVQITEIAYGGKAVGAGGGDGEYVELTNVGDAAQDFIGWAYEVNKSTTTPSAGAAGAVDLSGLGTVQPGESVIITDLTPAEFRTEWGLKSSVKVINDGTQTINSGPDTIAVFNGTTLADSLGYAKNDLSGKGVAAFVNAGHLDATLISTDGAWTIPATVADSEHSWTSVGGAVGSPGASTQGSVTPAEARNAGVAITGIADSTAGAGIPFTSSAPSAAGGTAPYTWSATGLPGGVNVDSGTGVISGTVAVAGSALVTLTATDSLNNSGSVAFTITTVAVDPNWSNIVINEVTSDNSDNAELASHLPPALRTALGANAGDLVELYNKGDTAVDITSWKQIDSGAATSATVFSSRVYDVAGTLITSIPAHGFGVFKSGPGLSSGGDAVKIYLPTGALVDSVAYTAGQAGYDESLDPASSGPGSATEVYHVLARCPVDGAGDVNTTSNDATTSWYSVTAASFGSSNTASCGPAADTAAAVLHYNQQPPTGLPGTCSPSAPSGSDRIAVPGAVAWPTSDGVTTADNPCEFITAQDPTGNDMSSLVFSSDGSVLWGAQNKNHLWKLVKDPSTGKYLPATDNGWGSGKGITFVGTDPATSQPDSEGLTVGSNGDLFATSERDNASNTTSKDEVLEYDPTAAGTTLAPVRQWDLTSEFVPSVIAATGEDANLGFEGVTFVPDMFLTAHGFHDQHLNKTYQPADYPLHGSGLFFLGLEKNGHVYAYALNSDNTFQRIADIDTGIDGPSAIADLQFNADDQGIWTQCDNDCGVVASLLRIGTSGDFARVASYDRPAGLPDSNLEGFAIAPAITAADGKREAVWSDDGIYGDGNAWNSDKTGNTPSTGWGHALYSGTIPVAGAVFSATPAPAISGTARVGRTLTATAPIWSPAATFAADAYQWYAGGGALSGQTASTLVLTPALAGKAITVTVTGTHVGYTTATSAHSSAVTVLAGTLSPTPVPTIVGTAKVGGTLTARAGTWQKGVKLAYQWNSNGKAIKGATRTSLALTGSLASVKVTVTVTGSLAGYTPAKETSKAYAVAKGAFTAPTPKISGTAKVGKKLTAKPGTWKPAARLHYQWSANGRAIHGATHATFRLTTAQRGRHITVTVTGTATGYATKSVTSARTRSVAR